MHDCSAKEKLILCGNVKRHIVKQKLIKKIEAHEYTTKLRRHPPPETAKTGDWEAVNLDPK